MNKGAATVLIIVLICILLVACLYPYPKEKEGEEKSEPTTTLYVGGHGPNNYTKIQDAVNNAHTGYTVYVYPGVYYENIKITISSLHLFGGDPRNTVINGTIGSTSGTCILVLANNVTIEGFGITHGAEGVSYIQSNYNSLKRCEIWGNHAGVAVFESSHNFIVNSVISENTLFGIQFMQNSCYNTASNILLVNNAASVSLVDCSYNVISKCGMPTSQGFGVHMANATNNTIINCTISYAQQGVGIYENTCNNTIAGNNISYNLCGIRINTSTSRENIFYHNTFLNNTDQAYDIGLNYWDNGAEGNYWSDYTGIDANGDSIGDSPYDVLGGTAKDHYPLMNIPFYLHTEGGW